jgi:hypothetical protein
VIDTGAFHGFVQNFQAFVDSYSPTPLTDKYWTYDSGGPHIHGSPVFWNRGSGTSYLYAWSERDHLKRFDYSASQGKLTETPRAESDEASPARVGQYQGKMPGGILSLSANGQDPASGVLWAVIENGDAVYGPRSGYFEAYDAVNLGAPLYKELIPLYSKSAPPTVANGHVYLATFQYQLRVYGLRELAPSPATWTAPATFSFCNQENGELSTGDVDGDGHSDLVCHDRLTGAVTFARATAAGRYATSSPASFVNGASTSQFCTPTGQPPVLAVGDFYGDGRTDIQCQYAVEHEYF